MSKPEQITRPAPLLIVNGVPYVDLGEGKRRGAKMGEIADEIFRLREALGDMRSSLESFDPKLADHIMERHYGR